MFEFTNNVAGSDKAMQVDQIAETFNEEQGQEHTGADPAAWTRPGTGEQYVNAFGKGAGQCYNCQGYGHLARECPSKGKGKGFEKGTDKEKGKGNEQLRADPQQREVQGEIPRGRCLELAGHAETRTSRRTAPKGKGKGPQPSGGTGGLARGVGDPGDPHPIAHPGADARPGAGGREQGGLDVDQYEVATGVRIPNFGEKKFQGVFPRKGPSGASPLRSAR